MNGFQLVSEALADRQAPLRVFFRDDDAGWADECLQELLAEFVTRDLPLDIAVIPEAVSERTAKVVKRALRKSDKISIHQHGFAHVNHQMSGRSSEFGSDRNYEQQRKDIETGQNMLKEMFGTSPKPIFTPPWNRCTADTAAALQSLDIKFLSRIVGSDPIRTDLSELPVAVDWLKKRKGAYLNHTELVKYISSRLRTEDSAVGVMLHHEHMDRENRKLLFEFIEALQDSRKVSFHTMVEAAHISNSQGGARRRSDSDNNVEEEI